MQAGPNKRTPCGDRRGSVAVEAALVLGLVLLPLLLAVWDLAEIVATRARMDAAMQAAILATWSGTDPAAVANAAYGPAPPELTVAAPQTGCVCITPSETRESGTATPCTGSCPVGKSLATYLSLSLTTALALPLPLPGLASPFPIATAAIVRVR